MAEIRERDSTFESEGEEELKEICKEFEEYLKN
ncbi:unnamed protein product [Camellia sinensis]